MLESIRNEAIKTNMLAAIRDVLPDEAEKLEKNNTPSKIIK